MFEIIANDKVSTKLPIKDLVIPLRTSYTVLYTVHDSGNKAQDNNDLFMLGQYMQLCMQ